MPRPRVHQHVNPLATYYRNLPVEPLQLEKVFGNAGLPLFLDIGCGRGRFLLEMAETDRTRNFFGIEIREPLVTEANRIAKERGLTNLYYELCNATFDLGVVLQDIPPDILQYVTIQFPDPWFKKKHAKRRMVSGRLVETVADALAADGRILIQTDIEFLAGEMFELFAENEKLKRIGIDENPLPVKTEREKSVEKRDLPVYRTVFEKIAD